MAKVEFSGNRLSQPEWCADFLNREHLMPWPAKLDPLQFNDYAATKITTSAQANASATSISVTALTVAIPAGTVLFFGETGELARLSADAAVGATSLSVDPLPNQIESGDVARYSPYGGKFIRDGVLVGRTYAERDASTAFGPAAITDDEIFLLAFAVPDAIKNGDCELVRPGTVIKENFLPDWDTLNTAANQVWTVTIGGTLSAGAFTLYDSKTGKTSAAFAYNANAATIQTALEGVYGTGDVAVAGTIASFTITLQSDQAGVAFPVPEIVPDGVTGLTGITVANTTSGGKALLDKLRTIYRCIKGEA